MEKNLFCFTNNDLKILKEFCKLGKNEEITSWKMMKRIFKNGGGYEDTWIRQRILKMSELGLFKIEGNPKNYILNSDKVFYKKCTFPNRRAYAISVFIENKWKVFEI